MTVGTLHCWAIGTPDRRAECRIGGTDLEAETPALLAQALIDIGAPDRLYLTFRVVNWLVPVNKRDKDGNVVRLLSAVSGYCSASVRSFAEGNMPVIDEKAWYSEKFAWMKRFG